MPHVAARTASRDRDTGRYQSHRPEQTLLYQIVDEYYPAFAALMAEQGKELPGYVQREFEEFLQCGRLEHGFLRVRCESCHAEHLVAFSGTVAKLAMRQPFVLFKGLTFQKLCLPGAFRPGDHHNK
ncbi:transposase zinc-binding domain-containing protein, partial [Salmonella enterica subsp. enterica serovar Enteritidis]|nr:transposase zinc-binding domain-containing protein [Salmonella enterica subsp. enterica serovar Enteritidis]